LAGIAVGFYFGFWVVSSARKAHAEKAPNHSERAPVPVRTALVERRTLVPSVEVIGTVLADPERFATLTAATPGLVHQLVAHEGDRVAAGATLVQMDDRPARATLAQAEAAFARLIAKPRPEELAQARALVAKMKSNHDAMEARLRKSRETRSRSPELVPEIQLLDDIRNAEAAKAELETAEAQMRLLEKGPRDEQRKEARTQVDAAQLQLDYCKVVAPFAGEVVDMKARIGQRADVGTPLVTLLDSSEVIVQARIPSNRLPFVTAMFPISQGQVIAHVHCLAFPNRELPAKTGWLSRQTEGLTGDVPLRLRVSNGEGMLRVGMTVRVTLHGRPVNCLAIPETAYTVNEEGKTVLVVVRDGKAVPTEVELAQAGEGEVKAHGWVAVAKGLHEGDQVIVEGGYALPAGTPVKSMPLLLGAK
jgi:cobalt-zinc-cadmium efflux system membrane fusion protein